MNKVEFIYDLDCPNIKATRKNLLKAFSELKIPPKWIEWDRNSSESHEYARKFGSPTILVDKNDIDGLVPDSNANCCRVYSGSGIPSVEQIKDSLMSNHRNDISDKKTGVLGFISIGPGVGAATLAKASCPLCYPAIAALLSSMGVGFLFEGIYFFALMALFFSIALFGLFFKAASRRGYPPFYLGTAGVTLALIGNWNQILWVFYIGVGALLFASFWNLWPKKTKNCPACP